MWMITDYRCLECKIEFEALLRTDQDNGQVECPGCRSPWVEKIKIKRKKTAGQNQPQHSSWSVKDE